MMMAFDVIHSILWPYLVKKSLFIFWADLEILAFISQIEGCFVFFFIFPSTYLAREKQLKTIRMRNKKNDMLKYFEVQNSDFIRVAIEFLVQSPFMCVCVCFLSLSLISLIFI